MSLSEMINAIRRNNLEELRRLVSTQKCNDDQANQLLRCSIQCDNNEITKFLLHVGFNPNSGIDSKPLHWAAKSGNLEIIEMLLRHGADINASNARGFSALVYAIKNKNEYATELLLERGARLSSNNEGRSPFHNAATSGSLKIIKMLLQNGALVNAVITYNFEKGYTPLHCACSSSKVDIDIIEFLFSNGADVELVTENGLTPLHIASQIGNVQVINLLLNYNSDINVRAKNSYTPLYFAIKRGNKDAALMLIHRGAKFNDEFSNGETILSLALEERLSNTVVDEILTRCPDLLKHCFYIQFFDIAIQNGYIQIIENVLKYRGDLTENFDDFFNSSLHIAVKSSKIESVEVLIAHGADVNAKDESGMTPLLYAAFYNVVEIAKVLLAAGANVNAANTKSKETPLHVACQKTGTNLIEVFLEHNADVNLREHNADVNLRDKNGRTPIHYAASCCEGSSVELLLENKASVNSQDCDGCTALHNSIDSAKSDIANLLLEFGADIDIKNTNNKTPMDFLFSEKLIVQIRFLRNDILSICLEHAFALDAINFYNAKDLQSSLSKLYTTDLIDMKTHFENCKQEIERLKSEKLPGYKLTCYAMMTRSIHSLALYVKNEDLITHFQSDYFSSEFPIFVRIILGRLRNAFQRRALIGDAENFFKYHFQLPHVCVDNVLSYLNSDDLKNVKDALLSSKAL